MSTPAGCAIVETAEDGDCFQRGSVLYWGQQANRQVGFSEEGFLMEMEGIVSVWAGVFETDKALREYFDYMPGRDIPPFSQDFFDGCDIYPFDIDFSERSVHEFTVDPEVLVCHNSEGTDIGLELKKLFPQGLEKPCNAAILVYNYKYDPEDGTPNPNAPVTFLGAVPCDLD